jgi:cobalt/nickel transport protein
LKKSSYIILGCLALLLVAAPLLLLPDAEYEGADGLAQELAEKINPNYEPWAESVFEPPNAEIESFFFALQAAAGAAFIGFYLGKDCYHEEYQG